MRAGSQIVYNTTRFRFREWICREPKVSPNRHMLGIKTFLAIILVMGAHGVAAADEDTTSTTTTTTTPVVTATTTVGYIEQIRETEYIYTNSDGQLTTTTATGTSYVLAVVLGESTDTASVALPTNAQSTEEAASLGPSADPSSASATLAPSSSTSPNTSNNPFSAPPGSYSTGYSTTSTTIDGTSAVVEYVVLYTNTCAV